MPSSGGEARGLRPGHSSPPTARAPCRSAGAPGIGAGAEGVLRPSLDDVAARLAAIDAELDEHGAAIRSAADGARRVLARLRASGKSPEEIELIARPGARRALLREVDALITDEERARDRPRRGGAASGPGHVDGRRRC